MTDTLTHEQILGLVLYAAPNDCIIAQPLGQTNGAHLRPIALTWNIAPEFVNIICAAPNLYRELTNVQQVFKNAIEQAEREGNDAVAHSFAQSVGALQITLDIARSGIEDYAARMGMPFEK